ncbi:Uncharacterised protein [uncultured archaeon]|nr:Uncharacterised protein [uncultured archaeon]
MPSFSFQHFLNQLLIQRHIVKLTSPKELRFASTFLDCALHLAKKIVFIYRIYKDTGVGMIMLTNSRAKTTPASYSIYISQKPMSIHVNLCFMGWHRLMGNC